MRILIALLISLISWLICGIFGYGMSFASLQEFDRRYQLGSFEDKNQMLAIKLGLSGPIGLIAALVITRFGSDGLKFFRGRR